MPTEAAPVEVGSVGQGMAATIPQVLLEMHAQLGLSCFEMHLNLLRFNTSVVLQPFTSSAQFSHTYAPPLGGTDS